MEIDPQDAGRTSPLAARALRIKAVVVDIDGTLTDGGMYYLDGAGEAKKFNVRDGVAIALLRSAGVRVVLASGESLPLLERRAARLKVDACFLGCRDKVAAIEPWLRSNGLDWPEVACVGDEINDVLLARACGIVLAVRDASPVFARRADRVLETRGGEGVLREVALWLLQSQGRLEAAVETFLAESCGLGR